MSHTAHPRNVDYTNSSSTEKGYLPSCRMAPDNFEKRSAVYTVVHQQSVISSTTKVMFHSGINKILNAEHFVVEFDSHSSNIICVLPVIYHTFLGIKTTNKSHCKHLDKVGKKAHKVKLPKASTKRISLSSEKITGLEKKVSSKCNTLSSMRYSP